MEDWKTVRGFKASRGEEEDIAESDTEVVSTPATPMSVTESVPEVRPVKQAKRQPPQLEEEREGGFVVVYRRVGRGTLHRLGAQACWMARKRSFHKAETYAEWPEQEVYSTICKLCWPVEKKSVQESSSDSCDELELSSDGDADEEVRDLG